VHYTNLNGKSSIYLYELINGEKHGLKGRKQRFQHNFKIKTLFLTLSAFALSIFTGKNFSFTR
jgi:hypothetical protein